MATYGENLQRLIDANCITEKDAKDLTPDQVQAIESLTNAQVSTLVDVRERVGPVKNCMMI